MTLSESPGLSKLAKTLSKVVECWAAWLSWPRVVDRISVSDSMGADSAAPGLPSAIAYAMAILVASLFSYYLFSFDFLFGHARIFEKGDFSQHLSGWQFYRDDVWHFPLLKTERLNAPDGVSIAFTDSIPLLAFSFKLLASWMPDDIQYFGFWHVLVIFMQAIGGVFLIRSLGCRQWYAALAGISLALIAPILPWRLGHSALMGHGLVLFALGFYFRGIRGLWTRERSARLLAANALLGLLVHPYWLALCFGVFLAFLVDDARTGGNLRTEVWRLLVTLVMLLVIVFVFGYTGSGMHAGGFGLYSMNLLAPVCGGRLTPCWVDATGGQYEGFNYLGAGVLLLGVIATFMLIRDRRTMIRVISRRYLGLMICALVYALYSLSSRVYFGPYLLFDLPLPDFLVWATGVFRASGRFFWLVGYLLTFVALAMVLKRLNGRWAILMLLVVIPLQWWDIQPHWQRLVEKIREPAQGDLWRWETLLEGVERINLHPAFGCQEGRIDQYFFFQRLAAHFGLTLDSGYIARPNIDCVGKGAKFSRPFEAGRLYVLAAPFFSRLPWAIPDGFTESLARGECAQWREALMCKPGMTPTDWSRISLKLRSTQRYLPAGRLEWQADNLSTNIGVLVEGELRPEKPEAHDFLSFGPYVALPAGYYRAQLDYRSELPIDQSAGAWDAVAAPIDGGRRRIYAEGALMGTAGRRSSLLVDFDVLDGDGPLEVRTIYPGRGDLSIIGLIVGPR
ncbi:hypothetical protein G3480_16140 [Thiorhodococcus mannitoliphagus]|uniref:YfhO family protein n=1 Tax=Thiorhodococcus mannitoliphagus TaxID=329406 RepID=A0A6P1DWK1_9GAMM|nr:DUF6311 domain-containing protein [Thiorhodococcus mannitoliphagus]NEX21820.1 hypothetical protein [Thiorhodococcus mannitoliphagus]